MLSDPYLYGGEQLNNWTFLLETTFLRQKSKEYMSYEREQDYALPTMIHWRHPLNFPEQENGVVMSSFRSKSTVINERRIGDLTWRDQPKRMLINLMKYKLLTEYLHTYFQKCFTIVFNQESMWLCALTILCRYWWHHVHWHRRLSQACQILLQIEQRNQLERRLYDNFRINLQIL